MSFYDRYLVPRMVNCMCGLKPMRYQRRKLLPDARGRILEIGLGSGLNLPFYRPEAVEYFYGLEPSAEILALAEAAIAAAPFKIELLQAGAEAIPLPTASVDTVVTTYTLCTILDPVAALGEVRRVLRPDGNLLFCEHGAAPDAGVRKWQDRLTPLWKKLAGGCHLNREIPHLIEKRGGLQINRLQTMYIPGPKPFCWNYWGSAVQR